MVYLILAFALCVAIGAWAGYVARGLLLVKAPPSKAVAEQIAALRDAGGMDAERANRAILTMREERRRVRAEEKAAKNGTR